MRRLHLIIYILAGVILTMTACANSKKDSKKQQKAATETLVGPQFSADSAFVFCEKQCSFGPRIMNSEAHEQCAQWIVGKFESYGMHVIEQRATLTGYDGTRLLSNNIIASFRPEATERILLCAHWDSRPWADNDPDEANWHKPVMAANDGASGVAVMLEIARLLSLEGDSSLNTQPSTLNAHLGIDFVCFDAEDWGEPQWYDKATDGNTWALGAQHWAAHPHRDGYRARFGILLDMVGGLGARFYREGVSLHHAPKVVERVWQAAHACGYASFFPRENGGYITDDHGPVNEVAGIPCIDIIPYYPDCRESSFGPTWHTVNDDMQHIDANTLKAVGQTLIQVLYSEKVK